MRAPRLLRLHPPLLLLLLGSSVGGLALGVLPSTRLGFGGGLMYLASPGLLPPRRRQRASVPSCMQQQRNMGGDQWLSTHQRHRAPPAAAKEAPERGSFWRARAKDFEKKPEKGGFSSREAVPNALRRARDFASTFIPSIVLFVFVRTFIVEPFYIPSMSMYPTLRVNDQVKLEWARASTPAKLLPPRHAPARCATPYTPAPPSCAPIPVAPGPSQPPHHLRPLHHPTILRLLSRSSHISSRRPAEAISSSSRHPRRISPSATPPSRSSPPPLQTLSSSEWSLLRMIALRCAMAGCC